MKAVVERETMVLGVRGPLAFLSAKVGDTLAERMFLVLTAVSGVAAAVVLFPVSLVHQAAQPLTFLALGYSLIVALLHWQARRGRFTYNLFLGVLALALNLGFLLNGGSLGSAPLFFYAMAVLVVVFFRGRRRWLLLGVYFCDVLGLLWVERSFPHAIRPFAEDADRLIYAVTGAGCGVAICWAFTHLVVGAYRREREQLRRVHWQLDQNLREIRKLRAVLPVCAWCRRVREENGDWRPIDRYLATHTEAFVAHALCPDCAKTTAAPTESR